MYSDQHIQIAIEIYIREGLPPEGEDQLWELFLSNPTWFDYFSIYLSLLAIVRSQKHSAESVKNRGVKEICYPPVTPEAFRGF